MLLQNNLVKNKINNVKKQQIKNDFYKYIDTL